VIEKSMSEYKVLVLGAGASKPFGFPVGEELRTAVIDTTPDSLHISPSERAEHSYFKETFKKSEMYSIDAFLTCRPEFSTLGKRYIAEILLNYEKLAEPSGNWYQYIWNHFRTPTLTELDFSGLKIITFNYDRSLEFFLLNVIKHTYGKGEVDTLKQLSTLEIVHTYGSLGPVWDLSAMSTTASEKIIPYGQTRLGGISANNISVIPDERADSSVEFRRARELLLFAKGICFLGFGFDDTNLSRLNSKVTCIAKGKNQTVSYPYSTRDVFASCLGLTPKECHRAFSATAQTAPVGRHIQLDNHEFIPHGFHGKDCLGTLRHTGFIHSQ
jgi:hypothetical protein